MPIYFDREFFSKTKNLETYSRLGFQRLRDIIREFEVKHADKSFKFELTKLREIAKESATELK